MMPSVVIDRPNGNAGETVTPVIVELSDVDDKKRPDIPDTKNILVCV